jgi:hypothetical protein
MKSGNLNFLEPSGPLQSYNGIALPFFYCKLVDYTNSFPELSGHDKDDDDK